MNNEPTNKEILDAVLGNRDAIKGNTDAIEMVARNVEKANQNIDNLSQDFKSFKNKHDSEMDIVRDDIRVLKTKVGV